MVTVETLREIILEIDFYIQSDPKQPFQSVLQKIKSISMSELISHKNKEPCSSVDLTTETSSENDLVPSKKQKT